MFYRYVDDYQEMYRKAVTAYTSNIPIYVNGYDINQSSYPAINYRPFSDRPYYSYVPVASFSNVGAKVVYDSQANVINVTTDYYLNKDTIIQLQNRIKELEEQIYFKERDTLAANNIVNFGFVATDGVWEYRNKLINGQRQLYKIKLDGSESKKLSDDSASSINVSGDWVYYTNFSRKLYKVKKDGTNRTKLLDININTARVSGDWIYYTYQDNGGASILFKMKTDGSLNSEVINDSSIISVGPFINVVGDWIYTTCYEKDPNTSIFSSYICKINTRDGNIIKIDDDYAYRINSLDDWIYYKNANDYYNIYKIKVDGTQKTKITYNTENDGMVYNFVVTYQGIYYSVSVENGDFDKMGLYKINNDGSGIKKLTDLKVRFINVINNWVYFGDGGESRYKIMNDGSKLQELN